MTKHEFEDLIKSGAIAGISISDFRKQGEGFALYAYGHWDDDIASRAVEEMGNCVTTDSGEILRWPQIEPLLDYILGTGWRHRVEIEFSIY